MVRFVFLIIATLILNEAAAKSVVNVAAAANVRDAMDRIKVLYEGENSDVTINVTYGASGVLVQQIMNGANFSIFFSADEEYAERLKTDGFGEGDVVPYATGKLALYSRSMDVSTEGLKALYMANVRRISVANPAVATYGTRAVEMLKDQGIYEQIKSKLIFGANISVAAQYVLSGNAEVGFVALSQIKSPKAEVGGYTYIIPQGYYNPIIQSCVLIKGASVEAVKFRDFTLTEGCKAIWREFGYE
ncbi:MAG: molybdate ABC transporter substrate-binding protein [Rikenellaceae bacterium]